MGKTRLGEESREVGHGERKETGNQHCLISGKNRPARLVPE
jgi:hypothetical protein